MIDDATIISIINLMGVRPHYNDVQVIVKGDEFALNLPKLAPVHGLVAGTILANIRTHRNWSVVTHGRKATLVGRFPLSGSPQQVAITARMFYNGYKSAIGQMEWLRKQGYEISLDLGD